VCAICECGSSAGMGTAIFDQLVSLYVSNVSRKHLMACSIFAVLGPAVDAMKNYV
jgi:hypothetical protein